MKTVLLEGEDNWEDIIETLSSFEDMFLGEKLGFGASRTVYNFGLNWLFEKDYVVKRDRNGGRHNFLENEAWSAVRYNKDIAKWFCPCISIGHNGLLLISEKAEPIQEHQLPKKIPSFFSDQQTANWGWLNGRAVCIDYEFVPYMATTKKPRLVKSKFNS